MHIKRCFKIQSIEEGAHFEFKKYSGLQYLVRTVYLLSTYFFLVPSNHYRFCITNNIYSIIRLF